MKREEKNKQTKRRIMDSALAEFSTQGYGASSINTISQAQGISKGIIYHYFQTKDDLFLACVEECFSLLTRYLAKNMEDVKENGEIQLKQYFLARIDFFAKNPVYQPIFCQAVISPPHHLKAEIQECKKEFDTFNIQTLERCLTTFPLRSQITKEDVIDTFRQFQDFINAKYAVSEFKSHEESCQRALDILLYGVIKREE